MKENLFLNIIILCAIFCKGIVGAFLEADTGESSNLLVRQKRVINRELGGDVPTDIGNFPYVVNIKKNGRSHCVGTILSHRTVITASRCFLLELAAYSLLSGSKNAHLGRFHNITEKKIHGNSSSRSSTLMTSIALFTVYPPFVFRRTTGKIDLHTGPILAGMRGTISGWASYCYGGPRETAHPKVLRAITVPIMNHRDCVNIYRGFFEVKDEDICTYHAQKQCGHTDTGAPLVIGDELVGIHIGTIETGAREFLIKPDVFALLQHLNYGQWIRENIV